MNPTEMIFSAEDLAGVVGVSIDKDSGKQTAYSALNAVHFAIVKALTDFGFGTSVAERLASGIGVAASTLPRSGWIMIRRQAKPNSGYWADDAEPIWVEVGPYEVAMYSDCYQLATGLSLHPGVCLTLNIGEIEADTISKLEAVSASR